MAEASASKADSKVDEKAPDAEMTEEKEEAKADAAEKEPAKPKEPEKPKEQEVDASEETRKKVSPGTVGISEADATLNAVSARGGKLLVSLTEGGLQYLLAGIRTTVGLKSGRYLLEVKILELHSRGEQQGGQARIPLPRQLVRLGLSHAGSSLLLADGSSDNVSFDSEGFFVYEKSRKKVSQKFGRDVNVALLINLDESSPNANTISLFRDGVRISEPQAIPEKMRGKPLYPTITYKNVTLQVNLGPVPTAPLPFKCHMLSDAAAADVEVATVPKPKGGKCDVLFPVGLPEQGFFDWVDAFLKKNPDYTELSDRKIIEWASKSGLWRPKVQTTSNDKPDMKFGVPSMDDLSVRQLLRNIAPTAGRNYIVPELKANLLASERKEAVRKFPETEFKKSAAVIVGEPTAEYKAAVQSMILSEKRSKIEAERKRKAAEEERKRLLEERKKKAEEARKAALKKKAGKEDADEEMEAQNDKEEEAKGAAKEEEEISVELTDEEKALWYRKFAAPDITEQALSKSYADFSFPTSEEGFDEVTYMWQPEAEAGKLLKDWILSKKLTQRVEDLQPGQWFKDARTQWAKVLQDWRKRQTDWKDPAKKKALLAKRAEAKKKEAEEKGEEAPKEEGMEIDPEDIDVHAVEDVNDIGSGEPLFANFAYEDWAMLSVRYELHLLLHSFKKDLDDPDRPSFLEKDLGFYYNKYMKKTWNLKSFGVDKLPALVELMQDTLKIGEKSGFLEPVLPDDTPVANFVKLTEEHRRDRQRRLDAGDETAELKFPRTPAAPTRQPPWQGQGAAKPPPGSVGLARPTPGAGGSIAKPGTPGAQKRAFTPPPASYVSKQPRTAAFGSGAFRR